MNVVALRTLRAFWVRHPRAEAPLKAWFRLVRAAQWNGPHDVREHFASADFVSDNRIVFNVSGNHYRIVARVSYTYKQVLVKFVGTHSEYDNIDVTKV